MFYKKQINVSSRLKTLETINWLKARSKGQVIDKYMLTEVQLKEQAVMKKIFKSLDKDNSNGLDRQELHDMFTKFGIRVEQNELKNFFRHIDANQNDNIDWTEFKNALTDEDASQTFINIMRRLRRKQKDNPDYIPTTFPKMIQYMNYCDIREDLIESIKKGDSGTLQKFKKCQELISLGEKCYSSNIINKSCGPESRENPTDQYQSLESGVVVKHINWRKRLLEVSHKKIRQVTFTLKLRDRLIELNKSQVRTVHYPSNKEEIKSYSPDQYGILQARQSQRALRNNNEGHTPQAQYKHALLMGGFKNKIDNLIISQSKDFVMSENQLPVYEQEQNYKPFNYRTQVNKTQSYSNLSYQSSVESNINYDNPFSSIADIDTMPEIRPRIIQVKTQIDKVPQITKFQGQKSLKVKQQTSSNVNQIQQKIKLLLNGRKVITPLKKAVVHKINGYQLSFEEAQQSGSHEYHTPVLKLKRKAIQNQCIDHIFIQQLINQIFVIIVKAKSYFQKFYWLKDKAVDFEFGHILII